MILIFLLVSLLINSCVLNEYSHMNAPEVSSCTLEESCIQVVFSSKMRKEITEAAFSCNCNGIPATGTFSWGEKQMYFYPACGIKNNSLYEVEIGTRAEDSYGNSLKEVFSYSISTGIGESQIVIQKMNISDGEVVSDLFKPILIELSKPVDVSLFYQKFSITPMIQGDISFKNNGKSILLTPLEKMEWDTVYTITIGEKKVFFSTPAEKKVTLSELRIKDGPVLVEHSIQHGVEKDTVLNLSYSERVNENIIKNPVTFSPQQSYKAMWNDSFTQCTITFDNPLPYKTLLEISTSDEKQYLLYVDGNNSVPPTVKEIRFYQNYSTGNCITLEYGSGVVFESGNQACFEIELSVGDYSAISPTAVYSAIDIEVSMGNLVIAPKYLETKKQGFNTALILVFCAITEGTVQTPVIISVNGTLKDSNSNILEKDYVLRINAL